MSSQPPEHINANVCQQEIAPKPRKKREMTLELLEKLKLARERAAELRNATKDTKSKLPSNIPEKEKTKVAQYLATRKAIKDKIKQDLIEEIEETKSVPVEVTDHDLDAKGFKLPLKSTEPPPPIPKTVAAPIDIPKKKIKEIVSDDEDEYTTIKIPKKKLVKWNKYADQPPPPEVKQPEPPKRTFTPYSTQHLINLKLNGYTF